MNDEKHAGIVSMLLIAAVLVSWMNSKACVRVVTSSQEDCANACGSNRMASRDRDSNCRCVVDADAGIGSPR